MSKRIVIAILLSLLTIQSWGQVALPSPSPVSDLAFRRAVAEALEELRAARKLIELQDMELKGVKDLLALERQMTELAKRMGSLSEGEIQQLRMALAAKDRVIAAREAEIAARDAQIAILKKKNSFMTKMKWLLAGAAAGIIAGVVLNK